MANDGRPLPNCVRYGLGDDIGFVELQADGTAEFWLGDADPMGHGVKMTADELPILRAIIQHLERGGFEEE